MTGKGRGNEGRHGDGITKTTNGERLLYGLRALGNPIIPRDYWVPPTESTHAAAFRKSPQPRSSNTPPFAPA